MCTPLPSDFGDGAQEGERRSLAVGAGHVHDGRQLVLRIPERGEQALDAAERQVDRLRMQLLEALKQRVAHRGAGAGRWTPGAIGESRQSRETLGASAAD